MGVPVLSRVRDIVIQPRGILDHTLLLLTLELLTDHLKGSGGSPGSGSQTFCSELDTYWRVNPGSADVTSVWDAFKAFSRGHYQSIIARVRRGSREDLTWVEAQATKQEALCYDLGFPAICSPTVPTSAEKIDVEDASSIPVHF